jgi:hypothetical protein
MSTTFFPASFPASKHRSRRSEGRVLQGRTGSVNGFIQNCYISAQTSDLRQLPGPPIATSLEGVKVGRSILLIEPSRPHAIPIEKTIEAMARQVEAGRIDICAELGTPFGRTHHDDPL